MCVVVYCGTYGFLQQLKDKHSGLSGNCKLATGGNFSFQSVVSSTYPCNGLLTYLPGLLPSNSSDGLQTSMNRHTAGVPNRGVYVLL